MRRGAVSGGATPSERTAATTRRFVGFLCAANLVLAVSIVVLEVRAFTLARLHAAPVPTVVRLGEGNGDPASGPVPEPLLAARQVAAVLHGEGRTAFRKCALCHGFGTDKPFYGPTLACVPGREIASIPDYRYSRRLTRLAAEHHRWSLHALYSFVRHPQEYAPNSRMPFRGLRGDRAGLRAVVQYLYWTCVENRTDISLATVEVVSIAGGDCTAEPWADWYARHASNGPRRALDAFEREPGLLLLPTADGAPGGAHCAGWPPAAP